MNISPLFGAISQVMRSDRAISPLAPPTPGCPPPGPEPGPLAAALRNSQFERLALNPQPIPPGRTSFDLVALNPQPLPPEPPPNLGRGALHASLLELVALNPQPLPPRQGSAVF
jgi:hypothetical protein